jgi:uncharacterized damage-inducible protein DinB
MARPDLARVPQSFHGYINQVKQDDLMTAFSKQSKKALRFFKNIPEDKHDYAYADGKWTLKELLQHIIDGERVFCYRALTISRNDKTNLPGFDENAWTPASNASERKWKDLLEEFKSTRRSSEYLFGSFSDEQLERNGITNNNPNYVLGLGFIVVGHVAHHMKMIKERYLK